MDTAAPTLNTTPGNNNNCDDDDIVIVIRRKDLPKIEQSKKYPNLYEYLDMLGLDYDYDTISNNLLVTNKFGKTLTVTKDMFMQLENSPVKHNTFVTLSISIASTKTYALEIFDIFENSRYDMLLRDEMITINNNITFKVINGSVKTEITPSFGKLNDNSDNMCIKSIYVKCGVVIFQKIITAENDDLENILYKLYPYQDYLKFRICDNGFKLVVIDETIKADPKLTGSSCLRQCFNKKYQKALENKMLRDRNIQ